MHTPVLAEEAIQALQITAGEKYIDATAGEGGHLEKILKGRGKVLGIDRDQEQINRLSLKVHKSDYDSSAVLVCGNFADIAKIAQKHGFAPADGILFDLGLSSGQIASFGLGFSFKKGDEPLDMRLNDDSPSAADLVNTLSEDELYEIFAGNSEEINSRSIAGAIVRTRQIEKIMKVEDLVNAIDKGLPQGYNESRGKTYARIFQALRIAVNNEFENLKEGLAGASTILSKGGRLVVISFHSLEDRIVKQFLKSDRTLEISGRIMGKKSGAYLFERSAVLRVATKR